MICKKIFCNLLIARFEKEGAIIEIQISTYCMQISSKSLSVKVYRVNLKASLNNHFATHIAKLSTSKSDCGL